MNLPKLKGKLTECDRTYEMCAKAIGISTASFSDKINGKSKFYIDELQMLGDFLEMDDEEKFKIFPCTLK